MAELVNLQETRTFKSKDDVISEISKYNIPDECRYIIIRTDKGQFYPIFIGQNCIGYGIHTIFHVVC